MTGGTPFMNEEAAIHPIHRSLNKPLTILGVERKLFFFAVTHVPHLGISENRIISHVGRECHHTVWIGDVQRAQDH